MSAIGSERAAVRFPVAATALVAAAAHVPVTGEHLREAPYIGVLFIALEVALVVLAGLVLVSSSRLVWWAAAVVPALAIVAYAVSRTVGLPQIGDDVGNWTEPLGVVSVVAETHDGAAGRRPRAGPRAAAARPAAARRAGDRAARGGPGRDLARRPGAGDGGRTGLVARDGRDAGGVLLAAGLRLAARRDGHDPDVLHLLRPGALELRAARPQRHHGQAVRRRRPDVGRVWAGAGRVDVRQVPLPRLHGLVLRAPHPAGEQPGVPRHARSGHPRGGGRHHPGRVPQHLHVPDQRAPARRVLHQEQRGSAVRRRHARREEGGRRRARRRPAHLHLEGAAARAGPVRTTAAR